MTEGATRTHCIRCGECCIRSSPTLQREDIPLVRDGHIPCRDLFTIRTGELVYDNIENRLRVSSGELIKIKEKDDTGACIFFDEVKKACRIYDHRPLQCAAFTCWDERPFMAAHKKPKMQRRDIIKDHILLGLMEAHGKKCSYTELGGLVRKIPTEGEQAVQDIMECLKFDRHIRPFVSEKLGTEMTLMDFVFGRPLTRTIVMFGLAVSREPDGSFLLSVSPDAVSKK